MVTFFLLSIIHKFTFCEIVMAKNILTLILSINLLIPCELYSQKFKVSALAGINFSQIDGDSLYGYNKSGLHLGGRLSYINNKSFDIALEMNYSQRGASKSFSNNAPSDVISANYIEIPIVFNIRDWYIEDDKYHKIRAEFGFSFARLIYAESPKFDVTKFNKNDVSWLVGSGLRFSPSWGIALRYTSSITNMYNDTKKTLPRFKSYFITFRTEYYF